MKTRIILLLHLFFVITFSALGQCSPVIINTAGAYVTSGTFCENQTIAFKANTPGYSTTTTWDFGTATFTQENPTYAYPSTGNYTVSFTGTGPAGTCTATLSVTILPSPNIAITTISLDSQCFEGNSLCLTDLSTAPLGKIVETIYIFSEGHRIDTLLPIFPVRFCKIFRDPTGGFFDLRVEAEDSNGCVATEVFPNIIYIQPKIEANFINATAAPNPGCGTTLGTFENTSAIALSKVDSFEWNYGDGTKETGTSDSSSLWSSTSHLYDMNGSFDVSLIITSNTGCQDTFTITNAITNVVIDPKIHTDKNVYPTNELPICFSLNGLGVHQPSAFLWNFGNPPSGNTNFNNINLAPCATFGLGPKMISLRLQVGPCDVTVYDTLQVVGPYAQIEAVLNRISETEKFQCGTSDSVHFTNASQFYQNDGNTTDEDSVLIVGGESIFAFNYIPPASGSGLGIGDQTPLTSNSHLANRTMGAQVKRIWDFGDTYAPQCTTSIAKGLNVGVNCNYSEDEFPVHKYQSWDSIYHNNFFSLNDSFACTKFNETTKTCYIEFIDSNNVSKHREIFDETVQSKYAATLTLHDTISGVITTDNVLIDFTRPDASKMTLLSGSPCPYQGSEQYIQHFDLNTDGQTYFAINYDTLLFPPTQSNSWNAYNGGQVFGTKPQNPLPFVLPYSISGTKPDQFYKAYSPGQLGNPNNRTPLGSISMGIIVGNGPATGSQPATCLDTAFYHDIIRIKPIDASFEIVSPAADKKYICAGDDAYFKLTTDKQDGIHSLRFNPGYSHAAGKRPELDLYFELFEYMQPYTGPSPTRNDKDITYSGEDWYYNYVIRTNLLSTRNGYSSTTTDTIVTAIVKDWKTEADFENQYVLDAIYASTDCIDVPKEERYKLWGTCIDTTGLSAQITLPRTGYTRLNGDDTKMHGDRRYRYTNAAQTDSIEVAHILHFRDSSLQGYDTLIVGTDTTPGLWKKSYTFQDSINGQLKTVRGSGPMSPSFSLNSVDGCQSYHSEILNVGFLANFELSEDKICKGLNIGIYDSIRYFQYGEEDPFTYPLNQGDVYWNSPARYAANPPLETFMVDWDKNDGKFDSIRGLPLIHFYDDPGDYIMTIVAEDSTGCTDTSELDISISHLEPYFSYETDFKNCAAIVDFTDSSVVLGSTNDRIISWYWDFGDGTRPSILQHPSHDYRSVGIHDVTLTVFTALGCEQEYTSIIYIPGPQPYFEHENWPWTPSDTFIICQGDSITLKNTSKGDINSPIFQMIWGDGSIISAPAIGETFSHIYHTPGTYELFLTVEDEIPGTGVRCSRSFPDTNPDLIVKRRIVVIVHESPEVSISTNGYPSYLGYPTTLTADLSSKYTRIKWIMGDGTLYNELDASNTSITHQYTQEGYYDVILAPEYDKLPRCWARDTFQIWMRHDSLISVTELDLGIAIFPNPAQNQLHIAAEEGVDIQTIQISDILSKVYEVKYRSKNVLDVSALATGTYLLTIETSKGVLTKKVQVVKE